MPSYDRAHHALSHVDGLVGRDWACSGRHGPPRLRSPAHAIRREGLAGDLLHDGDGALANERDGHRVGTNAMARDAVGGVGGADEGRGGQPMTKSTRSKWERIR